MTEKDENAERPEGRVGRLVGRLREHNRWRRGEIDEQPVSATQIGQDIDNVCLAVEQQAARIARLEAEAAPPSETGAYWYMGVTRPCSKCRTGVVTMRHKYQLRICRACVNQTQTPNDLAHAPRDGGEQ